MSKRRFEVCIPVVRFDKGKTFMLSDLSFASFNPASPTVMHIDLNSCFATIEQQANPLIRGKPVAVAAYTTPRGCILAASSEAKYQYGVKTGMRVSQGRALCPKLIVLGCDPHKYRFVNRQLLAFLQSYTADIEVKSIDEMVLNLANSPALEQRLSSKTFLSWKAHGKSKSPWEKLPQTADFIHISAMISIAREIKEGIRKKIGEWLTVSIGIGPNRFLAKTASNLHKPDGLDVICHENIEDILKDLSVEDLCGIKKGNGTRLRRFGITDALSFYRTPADTLKAVFRSIVGYHWFLRLHGWEIDERQYDRKSFGHSYALYKPYMPDDPQLLTILSQLAGKMGRRLRAHGFTAGGIHLGCQFSDWSYWHKGIKWEQPLFADSDLFKAAKVLLALSILKPVRVLSVSCHYLTQDLNIQLSFDSTEMKKRQLTDALDQIFDRWGGGAVKSGRILFSEQKIKDRIAFGGIKELEEFIFKEKIDGEIVEEYNRA